MLMDATHLPLIKLAETSNQKALHELGCLYLLGEGAPQDFLKARQYFEKMLACDNWDIYEFEFGEILACIGAIYFDYKNYKKANEYYQYAKRFIWGTYYDDFAQELCDELELDKMIKHTETP